MSKSIKFKNNTYLDSSSIVHKRKKLSDILEQSSIRFSINEEYVYSTDLDYDCFKIGSLVFLNIRTIGFKKDCSNASWIIKNLPKPEKYVIGHFEGCRSATGTNFRFSLRLNGEVGFHYSAMPLHGDSANKQYTGTIIYKSIE